MGDPLSWTIHELRTYSVQYNNITELKKAVGVQIQLLRHCSPISVVVLKHSQPVGLTLYPTHSPSGCDKDIVCILWPNQILAIAQTICRGASSSSTSSHTSTALLGSSGNFGVMVVDRKIQRQTLAKVRCLSLSLNLTAQSSSSQDVCIHFWWGIDPGSWYSN